MTFKSLNRVWSQSCDWAGTCFEDPFPPAGFTAVVCGPDLLGSIPMGGGSDGDDAVFNSGAEVFLASCWGEAVHVPVL